MVERRGFHIAPQLYKSIVGSDMYINYAVITGLDGNLRKTQTFTITQDLSPTHTYETNPSQQMVV